MWNRILISYEKLNTHKSDELQKQCDQIKAAVSRFSGIYENNTRMMTSGQTMDYVKELSYQQFPEPGRYVSFSYWDDYMVLIESSKFRVGMVAKRMRLGVFAKYSSSGSSHDLNDYGDADIERSFKRVLGSPICNSQLGALQSRAFTSK